MLVVLSIYRRVPRSCLARKVRICKVPCGEDLSVTSRTVVTEEEGTSGLLVGEVASNAQ